MSNRIALAPINDSRLNLSNGSTPKKLSSPKYKRTLYSKSFSVVKSIPKQKLNFFERPTSFSDYRPLQQRSNDTAGLAATKLKLKLQLALYKLQQTRSITHENLSISIGDSCTSMSEPVNIPPANNKSDSVNYKSSVNISLGGRTKSEGGNCGLLSKIAYGKNLQLFQIKRRSVFYTSGGFIPLTSQTTQAAQRSQTVVLQTLPQDPITEVTKPEGNVPERPQNIHAIPGAQGVILKTPVKNRSNDDTMDEDGDTTIANTTHVSPRIRRKDSLLSSSPIGNFGTPNSFSVAKSLLQLGGFDR